MWVVSRRAQNNNDKFQKYLCVSILSHVCLPTVVNHEDVEFLVPMTVHSGVLRQHVKWFSNVHVEAII